MTDDIMTLSGGDVHAHMMRAGRLRTIVLSFTKGIQSPLYLGRSELEDLRPWINEVLGKEPVTDDTLATLLDNVRSLARAAACVKELLQDNGYHEGQMDAYRVTSHLIEQAKTARPQPEQPKAKPWEPPDLATAPDNIADTVKGLTAEVDAALRCINALEAYQRDLGSHIDILMQNEARIEALEAAIRELRVTLS